MQTFSHYWDTGEFIVNADPTNCYVILQTAYIARKVNKQDGKAVDWTSWMICGNYVHSDSYIILHKDSYSINILISIQCDRTSSSWHLFSHYLLLPSLSSISLFPFPQVYHTIISSTGAHLIIAHILFCSLSHTYVLHQQHFILDSYTSFKIKDELKPSLLTDCNARCTYNHLLIGFVS